MAKTKPKYVPRKPPDLSAFVAGGVETSKRQDDKTTRYVRKRGDKAGEELRRLTVYLPMELERRLALRCAEQGRRPLSDAISEALETWLGR
jgi:hypothetical protein